MDTVKNMNDVKLKPKLLRSLIRDRLPDDKHPMPKPPQLLSVLSIVKTHSLLKEFVDGTADRKVIGEWRSAVDNWMEHVAMLVSSDLPDKRWVGICLLGVTCEECHTERFVTAYPDWFQKLVANIQMPCDSHFIEVACCASLSDLFTRLAGFTNLRKAATSLAMKLFLPVVQMLNKDAGDDLWVAAVHLLCTVMIFFPSSAHRYNDKIEATIVSKIMSGEYNVDVSKKLTRCLALLPKATGDEASWCLMMQKILIAINTQLDNAFQGLKEGIKSSEIMRNLVLSGKVSPPPLGGQQVLEESMTKKLELLTPRVSTLTQCLCIMIGSPYPVQVAIPIHSLLAVVERVLLVDGSLPDSILFTTALHQEFLCSQLPALHLSSLDLLVAIIKGIRSQLLPHAAKVVRLIKDYFSRRTLPCIRIKLYSIIQILLVSMGADMAQYLAQEVIENAFSDLGSFGCGIGLIFSNKGTEVESEVHCQSNNKKRKHVNEQAAEHQITVEKAAVPLSVQLAALRALEALLTMGGSLRSDCWRSNVDLLLITVSTKACDLAYDEVSLALMGELAITWADIQLAAMQALLASLLSPGHARPPYLSQGLDLFRRGKRETGTKLAAFCAHALLALEVLIHPRTLPMMDSPASISTSPGGGFDNMLLNGQKSKTARFTWNNVGLSSTLAVDDKDDDNNDYWLDNRDESGTINDDNKDKHIESIEELKGKDLPENTEVNEDNTADVEMPYENRDAHTSELQRETTQDHPNGTGAAGNSETAAAQSENEAAQTASGIKDTFLGNASDLGKHANISIDNLFSTIARVKERLDVDPESDLESIHIVDIEPDTDSD